MPSLSGGNEKQFSSQQQNPLLQQLLIIQHPLQLQRLIQMRMILKPKIAADEYEQGAYVYFDFQTPKDESQEGGW
ncbi:unnamed protein product [Brassica rapa subsp. trilocularis]